MNKLLLTVTIFFLVSCKNSHVSLSKILKGDCFWDRTGDKEVIGGLNSCYRFLPDGRCFFYYYHFHHYRKNDSVYHQRTDTVFRYDDDDVVIQHIWSVVGDSILIAQEVSYRVLNFSYDSIKIMNSYNH